MEVNLTFKEALQIAKIYLKGLKNQGFMRSATTVDIIAHIKMMAHYSSKVCPGRIAFLAAKESLEGGKMSELTKEVTLEQILKVILGPKGVLHGSKSLAMPLTIHNSNVVVADQVIWYGDINIHKCRFQLIELAKLFDINIKVYYESPVRQFVFTEEDAHKYMENQSATIKNTFPVWQTKDPEKFGLTGTVEEAFIREDIQREENLKRYHIYYKILTPNGTAWTWYNKPYYNYLHSCYRIIKGNYKSFISFPWEIASWEKTKIKRLNKFIKQLIKEVGYYKQEVNERGSTWAELLIKRFL